MSGVVLTESDFGSIPDKTGTLRNVKLFKWVNPNNITIEVISYGATFRAIKIPGKNGIVADIITGYDNIEGCIFF